MKKRTLTILCLLFYLATGIKAQTTKVDSLKNLLTESALTDFARFELWYSLHDLLKLSNFRQAAAYIDSAYSLSKDKNWEEAMLRSGRYYGTALSLSGKPDEAREVLLTTIQLAQKLADKSIEAYANMTLGNIEYDRSNFSDALPFYQQSRALYIDAENYAGASGALIWIGIINQYAIKNYDRAIATYKEAALLADKGNSTLNKSYIYANLGNLYEALTQYDSAIHYLEMGVVIKRQFNDQRGLGNSLESLANCYYGLEDYTRALDFYQQSKDIREALGDSTGLATSFIKVGQVYGKQGQASRALSNLANGKALAKRIGYKEALQESYLIESMVLEGIGNHKAALSSFKAYKTVSDSIFNIDSQKVLEELQVKYDTDKKEQQLALQNLTLGQQDAKLQRNQILIIALILVAVLLVAVLLLLRIRSQKEKALMKRDAELKLREAEISAVINSQEKERNRFAKDLHDGFGQMISVLKLNLSRLGDAEARDTEKRTEIFEAGESVINDMYSELRNICFDLMPQTLVKNGLAAALQEFGDRIHQTGKVNCEVLIFEEGDRLNELIEVSLFRIVQEWTNNVLKYADPSVITIQLTREGPEVTLTVEDNGQGFDTSLFYEGAGNGWKNVQSRLKLVNGTFDLDSSPGINGTMMTVDIANSEEHIPTSTDIGLSEAGDTVTTP